jgi:hypothetical protein
MWVEGTSEPVELRVHNFSPSVVLLEGGNDQIIRTRGGSQNEAQIIVRTLQAGNAQFDCRFYSRDASQEAARIAADIAPRLAALHASFLSWRQTLSGLSQSQQAIAALLDQTEAALVDILGSYSELIAMQDSVLAEFRKARSEAKQATGLSLPAAPQKTVALVAFWQQQSSSSESALNRIARLLAWLTKVSNEQDLLVDLCVVSRPKSGARVLLYPASHPKSLRETHTIEKIALFRGLYAYKAKLARSWIRCEPARDGSAPEDCGYLDLLFNAQPLISCDFDLQGCALRSGSSPEETCL